MAAEEMEQVRSDTTPWWDRSLPVPFCSCEEASSPPAALVRRMILQPLRMPLAPSLHPVLSALRVYRSKLLGVIFSLRRFRQARQTVHGAADKVTQEIRDGNNQSKQAPATSTAEIQCRGLCGEITRELRGMFWKMEFRCVGHRRAGSGRCRMQLGKSFKNMSRGGAAVCLDTILPHHP